MGEFQKKWFQVVWIIMIIASLSINYIQRWVDSAWAHSAGVEMLGSVIQWITLPLTIILFIWLCIGYWRTSERLFWRKLRSWGGALAIGIALAAVLALLIHYAKGEKTTLDEEARVFILGAFAAGGLIYAVARYKFQHWHKDR